jgi:hypothetical protein
MGKTVVNTKDENGTDMVVLVRKPNSVDITNAQLAQNKAFREAIEKGLLLREKIEAYIIEQGLWNEEKNQKIRDLSKNINDGERKLARGGHNGFTKKQARQLALDIRKWRNEQTALLLEKKQFDEYSVQGQSDNARFDYLVSVCTEKEDSSPLFSSLDDYRNRQSEKAAVDAAKTLASVLYDYDDDWQQKLPENKFLKQQGFVNDKLQLINSDGKLIDEDGRLVNENGRYINEEGQLVNRDGQRVDEEGNPVEEFVPFSDE